MKLTALSAGYYIVRVNGVPVSRHLAEREAIESAAAKIGSGIVDYTHEYVVRVEADKSAADYDMLITSNTGTLKASAT